MINFRFHLISLVAVFLALGIGVAMGASFVDRATVDSLRGRVDALEDGYRRRGEALDATRAKLDESDAQAAALAGSNSRAIADRLTDVPVVVIATPAVDDEVLEATRSTFGAAGVQVQSTMRVTPSFLNPAKAELATARDRLGIKGTGDAVVARMATDLGTALSLLSAVEPTAPPAGSTAMPTTVAGVVPAPTDVDQARAYVSAMVDLGMLAVVGPPSGAAFPSGSGFRYVVAVSVDDLPNPVVVPMVTAAGSASPATTTVAEARSMRSEGEATTTTEGQPKPASAVAPFRRGALAADVSTVDDLEESFGRIATVYAIAEQRESGRVGHYGTGSGASAPFATVPPR